MRLRDVLDIMREAWWASLIFIVIAALAGRFGGPASGLILCPLALTLMWGAGGYLAGGKLMDFNFRSAEDEEWWRYSQLYSALLATVSLAAWAAAGGTFV